MKKLVSPKSDEEMLRDYPLRSATAGWFIWIDEVANGCWEAKARDKYGRMVGKSSTDGNSQKLLIAIEALIAQLK